MRAEQNVYKGSWADRALTGWWRVSRHTDTGQARGGQHYVTLDAYAQVDPCSQKPRNWELNVNCLNMLCIGHLSFDFLCGPSTLD